MNCLKESLKHLEIDADRHKERLQENAALLQFMWKAEVVETWIGNCYDSLARYSLSCSYHRNSNVMI